MAEPEAEPLAPRADQQAVPHLHVLWGKKDISRKDVAREEIGAFVVANRYVVDDLRKNGRSFWVGVFTVFLRYRMSAKRGPCTATRGSSEESLTKPQITFLQNAIAKSPIVFFKLSEDAVGATDLVLTPQPRGGNSTFLNGTYISEALAGAPRVMGTTPRWVMLAQAVNRDNHLQNASVIALVVDSAKESELGVGKSWPYRPLGEQETHVTGSALRSLGVTPNRGRRVHLQVDMLNILSTYGPASNFTLGNSTTTAVVERLLEGAGLNVSGVVPVDIGDAIRRFGLLEASRAAFPEPVRLSNRELLRAANLYPPGNTTVLLNLTALTAGTALSRFVAAPNGTAPTPTPPPRLLPLQPLLRAAGLNVSTNANVTVEPAPAPPALQLLPSTTALPLSTLLDAAGLDPEGSTAVNVTDLLARASGTLLVNASQIVELIAPVVRRALNVSLEHAVVDGVESPSGKYSGALGSVALLELDWVRASLEKFLKGAVGVLDLTALDANSTGPALLAAPLQRAVYDRLQGVASGFDLRQRALLQIVQMNERVTTYTKNQAGMDADLIHFTNEVALRIGVDYAADYTLPVALTLKSTLFIRLFLDQIFNAVTAVLVFLGALLIYALLLSDVEHKTFDYGMLRALGMRHHVLVELLLLQSTWFALPGVALGLLAAFLLTIPTVRVIENVFSYSIPFNLEQPAVTYGVVLGLLMPLLANVGPIRRALSRTLRDALDIYHQSFSEVTVRMMRLEELGLSLLQTAVAVLLIVIGFVVYYLIPYAFTFGDLPLFFTLLIFILLGMLAGLAMASLAVQPRLERLVLLCILWGPERRFGTLVRKNLAAHRNRSTKTAAMFTVSIAFIVFAGAMFSLQSASFGENIRALVGADISVQALKAGPGADLNETALDGLLRAEAARAGGPVAAWTWLTQDMSDLPLVDAVYVSSLAGTPELRTGLVGLQATFLDAAYPRYFVPASTVPGPYRTVEGVLDVPGSLSTSPTVYSAADIPPSPIAGVRSGVPAADTKKAYGSVTDAIVMEGVRPEIGASSATFLKLKLEGAAEADGLVGSWLATARCFARKVPGFFFTSYRTLARTASTVLISEERYTAMLLEIYEAAFSENRTESVKRLPEGRAPKGALLVRLRPGATAGDRDGLINAIKVLVPSEVGTVTDTTGTVDSTKTASDLMLVFFNVVAVITITLCFFILWLSFTANVRENSWQLGVLRAVGVTAGQVARVFVYEAVCVVVACVASGTAVGLLVAVTLTLQFGLFTELPLAFDFPGALFALVVLLSLAAALLGSWLATRKFTAMEITRAMRG
eukprot:tig00001128_g7174.t1